MMDSSMMGLVGPAPGRLTVLIMDDAVAVRSLLAALLLEIDTIEKVVQAEDAASALRLVDEQEPDIAILDINLRGAGIVQNGIDVLREVKGAHPEIEVLMLTNHATEPYRVECEKAGADYFYDKASEFDQLLDRVAAYSKG
jgi:DNA-binding NarL/FixJ family response regulator